MPIQPYNLTKKTIPEIIWELAKLKGEITELEEKFLTLNGKSYSYYMTLQEIKKIILQEKVTNNKKLRAILDLITKAEEE